MNILVTGAKGFIGRNLCENLKNVRDCKDPARPHIHIEDIYEFDTDSSDDELSLYVSKADFVFHLAGVNRPKNSSEFKTGNVELTAKLLELLEKKNGKTPVMLSSSAQASLSGRFGVTEYGVSKKESEKLVFEYGLETGAEVYVYRFPNVVGKWARPNYNSAVVTFCYNISRNLPIKVNDRETELEILFVEDLVDEMIDCALTGRPHRCGPEGSAPLKEGENSDGQPMLFCKCPVTYKKTLGEIVDILQGFKRFQDELVLPEMPADSFEKKLISTYVSYLPEEAFTVSPKVRSDSRGSFAELLKMPGAGQVSVNVTYPGETKGLHWHNTKWELFIVVSGRGLIRERKIGSSEVREFEVSGDDPKEIFMIPGYTHSITNLSDTENLVTIMYANELFNGERPDTFREEVYLN